MEFVEILKVHNLEIPSSRKNLEKVEKFLKKINKEFSLDTYRFNNLLTAVTEVVLNAIVHGNKEDINKKVMINVEYEDNVLTVRIEDEGLGIDKDKTSNPELPENVLNESGRGMYIVKTLVNDVDYCRTGSGFCCLLTVKK